MFQQKTKKRGTTATGAAFQAGAVASTTSAGTDVCIHHDTVSPDVRQNEDAALHTRARDIARRRLAMASDRRTRAVRAVAVALFEAGEEGES